MDIKAASRFSERKNVQIHKRLGEINQGNYIVCKYWLAGRCARNPCRFLHSDSMPPQPKKDNGRFNQLTPPQPNKKDNGRNNQSNLTWRNTNCKIRQLTVQKLNKSAVVGGDVTAREDKTIQKAHQKQCKYWVTGNCVHGDKCADQHSWYIGVGFSLLTRLEGHTKAVTGLALPLGSDKLYSGSKDSSMRVWDCNTGKCSTVVDLNAECGTLIGESPWVFVGVPNSVKAWNFQSHIEHNLEGSQEQVHAIAVHNELLFVGAKDGIILVWRATSETSIELVTSLKGHSRAVLSLVVGANRLYSGSADFTIREWDLETLKCIQTLSGHTSDVTSLICWDRFLISGSLDHKLKVWAATESGNIEMIHKHIEDDGVISLCGITDAEAKPILLCSCKDNTVRLYELPSFSERGRIFSKGEVRAIEIGTGGLFFTGDATGQISVWKLDEKPQ